MTTKHNRSPSDVTSRIHFMDIRSLTDSRLHVAPSLGVHGCLDELVNVKSCYVAL